jgi:hypothetical protein
MFRLSPVVVSLSFFSLVAAAQAPALLGGVGESCRARADCQSGLSCIKSECVAPAAASREGSSCGATSECQDASLKCIQQVCRKTTPAVGQAPVNVMPSASGPGPFVDQVPVVPAPQPAYAPPPNYAPPPSYSAPGYAPSIAPSAASRIRREEAPEPVGDVLAGRHPYIGGALGFGPLFGSSTFVEIPIAVRGGVWFGQLDLQFDLSPFTDLIALQNALSLHLQGTVAVGYFLPFYRSESFAIGLPLRAGIGLKLGGLSAFVLKADVLGLALRFGSFHLEFNLPTVNFLVNGDRFGLSFPLTVSGTFLF